ncbi:hypothetical protein P872_13465 [Rhodonellum psychrophilum GCM71 = DSM 17998]|uniref:histidine kinase n=2 Tax=Rhodonellum TaxID=336827 RepID=U5BR21_9BACT|nr:MULTISPECIES: ATP-binding protein [Rhodonellum]ERM80328.1 hypothetical protein P872_13465 [Rhodonellum psychrophilum GCM71 = DSM 17998]SDZ58668.1 Histidine kinase-, DNA gyrase B-, and HSP90-like ATPase [Rhodonellum ikkaensis]
MGKEEIGIKKFEGLGLRYILALTAIATTIILSQVFLQFYISQQEDDSIEVNLSGRQRMLSQRISKSAVLLGASALDSVQRGQYLKELKIGLGEWKLAHHGLQFGNPKLGLQGDNSKPIQEMFRVIEPHFQEIVLGAEELIRQSNLPESDIDLKSSVERILSNESHFLDGMDKIVFQYDAEAQSKVSSLKRIEFGLLLFALLLIFIEVRFIFWPSAAMVKKTFQQLRDSESKARKMALEISSLYESLEQSYQDLAEVEVEIEDFTVFGKCDTLGEFTHFSDKFCQVMEFDKDRPNNFFAWLEQQGYSSKYLDKILKLLNQGITWKGDIKVTNGNGDFVWLKIHLVPVFGENQSVASFMIISVDETEVKEAQARSQEINKERLDKKLKEQQYRSVLILEGQEEERRRISRDMHDGVGQYLTALKYSLDGIYAVKSIPERKRLELSKELLKDVIKEVRRISFNLTPVALSDYGIVPVLNKFSEEMTKISKIPVVFENQTGFISRLEPKIENNLYRIVQEAVNNAIKYSEASEIRILLSHNAKYLHLEIRDDGKGFDYKKLKENGYFNASGHGIFNIKERVNLINGQFSLETGLNQGTSVNVDLPLES